MELPQNVCFGSCVCCTRAQPTSFNCGFLGALHRPFLHRGIALLARGAPSPAAQPPALLESLDEAVAARQPACVPRPSSSRSADGILHADQGCFALFDGCMLAGVEEALQVWWAGPRQGVS